MLSLQKNGTGAALALLCAGALLAGTRSAAAEVTFKGKTIDVIIATTAGGGTDGTTRLVGRFLEKHLPGNPTMRYRNIPGGQGAKGLNYFIKTKPDGLTWAGGSSEDVNHASLRRSVVEYNPTKFHFFGGVNRGGSIIFIRKEMLPNLTDQSKPPVVVGALDGNRSWEQAITFGKEVLGWNVRFVVGYPGTSFMMLAVRRGETHMMGTSNLSLLKDLLATGEFVSVFQLGGGTQGEDDVEVRSDFKNTPTFPKLMEGKVTGVAAEALDFWTALQDSDKWYALPPGTPKEILETYRTAWTKMVKDPEFLRLGRAQFSPDFSAVSGERQQEMIEKTAYPATHITAFMDELKIKNGLPSEPLSDEELVALAKAKGLDKMDVPAVKATLAAVNKDGREIEFPLKGANQKLDVSSGRTRISIAGQKAARGDLKSGMNCSIEFIEGAAEASGIACQ